MLLQESGSFGLFMALPETSLLLIHYFLKIYDKIKPQKRKQIKIFFPPSAIALKEFFIFIFTFSIDQRCLTFTYNEYFFKYFFLIVYYFPLGSAALFSSRQMD